MPELELATLEEITDELAKRHRCLVLGVVGVPGRDKPGCAKGCGCGEATLYRFRGGRLTCMGMLQEMLQWGLETATEPLPGDEDQA